MSAPIAITMGDPAGVGPEIIIKLLEARTDTPVVIFGDARLFSDELECEIINDIAERGEARISIVDIPCAQKPQAGQPQCSNAPAVIAAIENAVNAVKAGQCSALLTAPINKENLVRGAAFQYPGHTEFLAALDGNGATPVMLLCAEEILRVVPVTIHIPLKDVPSALTNQLIANTARIVDSDLSKYLGQKPRIAVAGLNPHAGENGILGNEEQEMIAPAIKDLQEAGLDVQGPYSADTLFNARARAQYDVALCMYHDQALIPIKTLAFDEGVNVTLGLSFLRTSPDHGTAYDIAGQGIANPKSMIAAYDLALKWGQNG